MRLNQEKASEVESQTTKLSTRGAERYAQSNRDKAEMKAS